MIRGGISAAEKAPLRAKIDFAAICLDMFEA
jgi:hypothetical protein